MFYSEYPNTNFHEMNLDWIIEKLQELEAKVDKGDADILKDITEIRETILVMQNQINILINKSDTQANQITNIYNILGFFISPVTINAMRLRGFVNDTDELKVVNLV